MVTYFDKEGNQRKGYQKNGITYKDEEGIKRVESGSLVNADGKMYVVTDFGGILYSDFYGQNKDKNEPSSLIGDYKNALSGAALANEEGELSELNARIPGINRSYDAAARMANVRHEQVLRGLANQLSSAGLYNSGYSDSEISRQAAALGKNLTDIEMSRQRALEETEAQKALARLSVQKELASIQALAAQMGLSQYNIDRDFAYRKERDASADRKWERELALRAGSLQSGKAPGGGKVVADPLEIENGVQTALKFINIYGNTISPKAALEMIGSQKEWLTEKLGATGYDAYVETVLSNYPGMSGAKNAGNESAKQSQGADYTGKDTPEALYELVFGAKTAHRFIKNGKLDHEAVYKLLLASDMSPGEKVRFANMAGLSWW